MDAVTMLREAGVSENLIRETEAFRKQYSAGQEFADRIPQPQYIYYGKDIWNQALAALLAGSNLLLAGPKATGKNVLADCLSFVLGRPQWNVSFHVNVDAAYLIGTDTYDGSRVVFREGPIYKCAVCGGFAVLDEINMAKNEALAVLHATLDHRRMIDVPGYDKISVAPSARFIGTMNYGYAGTRDLNEALVSRFAVLEMPVISEENLKKLLHASFPHLRKDVGSQLAGLFYDLQKKAEHADISERAVDLRGILESLRLVSRGVTLGDALTMCITNKSFDLYERKLIEDVIHGRFPKKLTAADLFIERN